MSFVEYVEIYALSRGPNGPKICGGRTETDFKERDRGHGWLIVNVIMIPTLSRFISEDVIELQKKSYL